MGMLAFFPWLVIEEPIQVDTFHLVPFQKGEAPVGSGSHEQAVIDAVLAPFKETHGPVNVATLAHLDGKPYTADLGEEERNELFVFSRLVAFGGLATREYCARGFGSYCNSADFAFLIQGFRDTPDGTFFDVRRRDGHSSVRVTADAYQVMAPPHLSFHRPVKLDVTVIKALLAGRGGPIWNRVFDALDPFMRANTDSGEITEQSEVVDMVGAFEKALGVWGSDDLKREFELHFRPTSDISPRDAPRVPPALRNGPSLRRLWVADLYELRNAHAHGDPQPPTDLIWDRAEHLLLAAYGFPLLVKSLLSEEKLYELTREDQTAIDLFEWRAKQKDHLLSANAQGQSCWSRAHLSFIREHINWEHLEKAIQEGSGEVT